MPHPLLSPEHPYFSAESWPFSLYPALGERGIEAAGLGKGAECRGPGAGASRVCVCGSGVSLWLLGTSCVHVTTLHVSVSRGDVGSTEGGDQRQQPH